MSGAYGPTQYQKMMDQVRDDNARKLARAAPEMFAALVNLVDTIEKELPLMGNRISPALERAKAAIASATPSMKIE